MGSFLACYDYGQGALWLYLEGESLAQVISEYPGLTIWTNFPSTFRSFAWTSSSWLSNWVIRNCHTRLVLAIMPSPMLDGHGMHGHSSPALTPIPVSDNLLAAKTKI
jgi:hypothetical protein